MDALSDLILFSFLKKIQDGRHDVIIGDFFKMVQSSWNGVQIFLLVCILIMCCFHIDRKSYAAIFIFFSKICDDYSSRTKSISITSWFSLDWRASRFKYGFHKMADMTSYVKCGSHQNYNFVKNDRILTKFDMYVHMDVLSDLMLFSFSKNPRWPPWCHNCRFFKVFWKFFKMVHILIFSHQLKIQNGHFGYFSRICDYFSCRTTSGRDHKFQLRFKSLPF